MKLYYAPGACSLAPHIALRECGASFDLVRVDLKRGALPDGTAFGKINPKGYVPALELTDGRIVTENAAVLQYIADLKPESNLAPRNGTFERVRLQEWLVYIATELHKGLAPLFAPSANDSYKAAVRERLSVRFDHLARSLHRQKWLFADDFTVADAYALYALRTWERMAKVDLSAHPTLAGYQHRIEGRPAVRAALAAEGLP